MTTLDRRLADNIRAAREAAGLTQMQLAVKLGLSGVMAISRWERAESRPKPENLAAIAQLLNQPVAWFYVDHGTAA